MTENMRAYVGGQDVPPHLADVPRPTVGAGEVLVVNHAAALNNADLTAAGDERVAGFEFAGVVEDVGAGVPQDLRGARVAGIASGTLAEVVIAHHRHVFRLPDTISFEVGATLPTAFSTELGALTLAGVRAGTSVLITAASSSLGLVGIQVARLLGAERVVGTTRTPGKADLLREVGADAVVVTSREDLAEATRSATGGWGADVVLDHVGGDQLDAAVAAARDGGDVVSVGRLAGGQATLDLFAIARRHVRLQSVSYGLTPPEVLGDLLDLVTDQVLPALVDGRLRAVVDRTYALEDAGLAFDRLASGAAAGKVVVRIA
jgi:NADPH2:quinone reductase